MEEDGYAVDDAGNLVDADAQGVLRRQVTLTLRFMVTSTVIGLVIIAGLAIALSSIRGVLILVGVVYLATSVAAYVYLRRTLNQRLERGLPPVE